MGKFQRRQTITPVATLLGWRKLNDEAFSGQLKTFKKVPGLPKVMYMSYMKFDFVTYHEPLAGYWPEHYLGERDGVYITMLFDNQSTTTGPEI